MEKKLAGGAKTIGISTKIPAAGENLGFDLGFHLGFDLGFQLGFDLGFNLGFVISAQKIIKKFA